MASAWRLFAQLDCVPTSITHLVSFVAMMFQVLILTLLAVRSVCGTEALREGGFASGDVAHIALRQDLNNGKSEMDRLHAQYTQDTKAKLSSSGGACTSENISVRREW